MTTKRKLPVPDGRSGPRRRRRRQQTPATTATTAPVSAELLVNRMNDNDRMHAEISERILTLRLQRGMTQAELADAAHVSTLSVMNLEDPGYHNWNITTLRKICYALDLDIQIQLTDGGL